MWDKTFRQTWLELFSVLTRILTIRAKQLVILIINLYSNCHLKFTTTLGCQRHLSPESTSEHFFIGQLPFLYNVLLIITCLKHYKKNHDDIYGHVIQHKMRIFYIFSYLQMLFSSLWFFGVLPLVATCPLFSQPPFPNATQQDVTTAVIISITGGNIYFVNQW